MTPPSDQGVTDRIRDIGQLRHAARAWLSTTPIPKVPLDLDERFDVLRAWQRTLFDAGWMGLAWPTDVGGRGLTALHQHAFAEELARAHAPAPIGLIGLDVVGPSINAFGTAAQRARHLAPLLSSEEIWCQGFSEPEAGSDLASLRTRAVRDGEHFVIDGQKVWTSWARQASWCALLCRTDPAVRPLRDGISYLLVDMSSPGITVRPIVQMTGDAEFCEIFFEGVRVPTGNLLGAEHGGWRIALDTLSRERGNYTVRRQVEIGWMFDDALAALRAQPQGRRAAHRVTSAVGEAHLALRVLEAQTRRTAARLVADAGPDPLDSVDKLVLNDAEQAVCAALADLVGPFRLNPDARPLGLDSAQVVHDHYYSRAASIYGGTAQIQRNIVSERLLGLPRERS